MFRCVRAHAFVLLRLRAMARVKSSTAMERYIIIATIVSVMIIATIMTIITSRWCYHHHHHHHHHCHHHYQVVLQRANLRDGEDEEGSDEEQVSLFTSN